MSAGVAACALGYSAVAQAANVLVLGRDGHVSVRNEPYLVPLTPAPTPVARSHIIPRARPASVSVARQLGNLMRSRAISATTYQQDLGIFDAAAKAVKGLRGTRAAELQAVINNLYEIAGSGSLTPGRLPAVFLTLDRNRQWWTTAPIPSAGQIVSFAGSQIEWEYYQGQGLEIQELGSFGKAQWFFSHGARYYAQGRALLAELIPLASHRGGGVTWEYFFNFDGGAPPWTSAMSQGTALQALADGYKAVHDRSYLDLAHLALPVLTTSPPRGVAVRTPIGIRYVLYSFDAAAGDEVINGFLQTLIGLDDYATVSGDSLARQLFNAGNTEAQREVPHYDTGKWSLYQPGILSPLSYHELLTGFLQQLCALTHARVYCVTAAHFHAYLKHPPPGA